MLLSISKSLWRARGRCCNALSAKESQLKDEGGRANPRYWWQTSLFSDRCRVPHTSARRFAHVAVTQESIDEWTRVARERGKSPSLQSLKLRWVTRSQFHVFAISLQVLEEISRSRTASRSVYWNQPVVSAYLTLNLSLTCQQFQHHARFMKA
ncbi:hypothetical protein BKA62DRAFT_118971 [Auriculariales sp. MPI-PUGE-AT-0066]|nr:hypothetical protein BKA62DRAFT_118971 [Auriculariales sp. MPI-PUGE-AT-0066]